MENFLSDEKKFRGLTWKNDTFLNCAVNQTSG